MWRPRGKAGVISIINTYDAIVAFHSDETASGFGFGLGNIVTLFTEFAVHIPMDWALRGLIFCTVVGLTFGMWPAVKASRMTPVEALSHE